MKDARRRSWSALALLLGLALLPVLAAPGYAAEPDTIVIDGNAPRTYVPPKADRNTRVITVKGRNGASAVPDGDICADLGARYICSHVGLTAFDASTGETLGTITGVAWKRSGEVIGTAAPEPDDPGPRTNITAARDGFYYMVGDDATLVDLRKTAVGE
jgi:hypothetical protein